MRGLLKSIRELKKHYVIEFGMKSGSVVTIRVTSFDMSKLTATNGSREANWTLLHKGDMFSIDVEEIDVYYITKKGCL